MGESYRPSGHSQKKPYSRDDESMTRHDKNTATGGATMLSCWDVRDWRSVVDEVTRLCISGDEKPPTSDEMR